MVGFAPDRCRCCTPSSRWTKRVRQSGGGSTRPATMSAHGGAEVQGRSGADGSRGGARHELGDSFLSPSKVCESTGPSGDQAMSFVRVAARDQDSPKLNFPSSDGVRVAQASIDFERTSTVADCLRKLIQDHFGGRDTFKRARQACTPSDLFGHMTCRFEAHHCASRSASWVMDSARFQQMEGFSTPVAERPVAL